MYRRVSSVLARSLVFPVPCSSPAATYRCSQPSSWYARITSPTSTGSSCWNLQQATVHFTAPDHLNESVNQAVYQYRLTGGSVRQVVVGQDLRPTNKVVPSVAAWLVASYTKVINHSTFPRFTGILWPKRAQLEVIKGDGRRGAKNNIKQKHKWSFWPYENFPFLKGLRFTLMFSIVVEIYPCYCCGKSPQRYAHSYDTTPPTSVTHR